MAAWYGDCVTEEPFRGQKSESTNVNLREYVFAECGMKAQATHRYHPTVVDGDTKTA
jgi:hypothetical protein